MGQRKRIHSIADHAALGQFLKGMRVKHGMTQSQIAEKLGQKHALIWKIESGERQLQVLELIDICDALGIAPSEFIDDFVKSKGE